MSGQVTAVVPVSGGGREFCSNVWKYVTGSRYDFVVAVSPNVQGSFTGFMKRMALCYDILSRPDVVVRIKFSLLVRNLTTSEQVGEKLYMNELPVFQQEVSGNFDVDLNVPFSVPAGCALVADFAFVGSSLDDNEFNVCANFRWDSSDIVLSV